MDASEKRTKRVAPSIAESGKKGEPCVSVLSERGIAAVEFVVVFPILLLMLLGIVEFGRYYNASITVTHAAREAVRPVALGSPGSAGTAATNAASPLTVTVGATTTCPANGTGNASITVNATFAWDPLFLVPGLPTSISRTAVMRCGG